MPVLYYAPFNVPYGECDACGAGSMEDREESVGLNEDRDHNDVVCSECWDERYYSEPSFEYGEDEDSHSDDERSVIELYSFDSDFQSQTPRMLLPVLENRPYRLVSIEQEVASGGEHIARLLHDAGFTTNRQMIGYHSSQRAGGFCAVEADSSVDGEIIYGKLRLDTAPVAFQLENALNVVREAVKEGVVSLDARCGFHVHVDVKGYGMSHVENLYHLWNHLEDVIYRLASANWSDHRINIARTNYAATVRKGLVRRTELGQWFQNTRECGLNLSNYLAARGYCECGAFTFGEWQECTCDLPKSTAEFRVFNGTANLRKVHAYTALSLALVEYAQSGDETFSTLPAQTFGAAPFGESGRENALELIFGRLPLTTDEKDSLRYCAENSSLRNHAEYIERVIG